MKGRSHNNAFHTASEQLWLEVTEVLHPRFQLGRLLKTQIPPAMWTALNTMRCFLIKFKTLQRLLWVYGCTRMRFLDLFYLCQEFWGENTPSLSVMFTNRATELPWHQMGIVLLVLHGAGAVMPETHLYAQPCSFSTSDRVSIQV